MLPEHKSQLEADKAKIIKLKYSRIIFFLFLLWFQYNLFFNGVMRTQIIEQLSYDGLLEVDFSSTFRNLAIIFIIIDALFIYQFYCIFTGKQNIISKHVKISRKIITYTILAILLLYYMLMLASLNGFGSLGI